MEQIDITNYQAAAMRTAKALDFKMNLVHATLGMCSEIGELVWEMNSYRPAISEPTAIKKELGDFFWFTALACQTLQTDIAELYAVAMRTEVHALLDFDEPPTSAIFGMLLVCGGELQTLTKRISVYEKPMDSDVHSQIIQQVAHMYNIVVSIALYYEFEIADILLLNIDKLQNKETGRYKDGAYSNEAALERNDEK